MRPEDIIVIAPGEGQFDMDVYTVELTGESILVTKRAGKLKLTAHADRYYRCKIGDRVGIRFQPSRGYLFDQASENRLRLNNGIMQ